MFGRQKELVTNFDTCYVRDIYTVSGLRLHCISVYDHIVDTSNDFPFIRNVSLEVHCENITDIYLEKSLTYDKKNNKIKRRVDIVLKLKNFKYSIIRMRYVDYQDAILFKPAKKLFFGLFKTKPIYMPKGKFDSKKNRRRMKIYDTYKHIINSLICVGFPSVEQSLVKKCIKQSLSMNKIIDNHELVYTDEKKPTFKTLPEQRSAITSSLPEVLRKAIYFSDCCCVYKSDIRKYEFTSSAHHMLRDKSYRGNLYLTENRLVHIHYSLRGMWYSEKDAIIYSISKNEVEQLFDIAKKKCEDAILDKTNN